MPHLQPFWSEPYHPDRIQNGRPPKHRPSPPQTPSHSLPDVSLPISLPPFLVTYHARLMHDLDLASITTPSLFYTSLLAGDFANIIVFEFVFCSFLGRSSESMGRLLQMERYMRLQVFLRIVRPVGAFLREVRFDSYQPQKSLRSGITSQSSLTSSSLPEDSYAVHTTDPLTITTTRHPNDSINA